MIGRLVFNHDKRSQLIMAIIGSIIGFIMMLLAVQIYADLTNALESPKVMGRDFLVLNKEVGLLSNNNFSLEEIEEIKKQPTVLDAVPVEGNQFHSYVEVSMMEGATYSTLAPLIAVPDNFIDNISEDWGWITGDTIVPVIVPSTYFNSFNFGIAEATKSPKISKKLIEQLRPRLQIGHKEWFTVEIVAFSDRFSDGVIVPGSFLAYGNENYAKSQEVKRNRIVISTPNAKNPKLAEFIESKGYQTNLEKLRGGKITETMNILLPIVIANATIIIVLALLTFIQNAQLMLANSSYELNVLGMLGYNYTEVSKAVMRKFNKLFLTILFVSAPVFYLLKRLIDSSFKEELGLTLGLGVSWMTVCTGLLVLVLLYIIQLATINKTVRNALEEGKYSS